jgi:hypothetical protein
MDQWSDDFRSDRFSFDDGILLKSLGIMQEARGCPDLLALDTGRGRPGFEEPDRSAYRSRLLKTTKAMKVTVTLGALPGVESNESQERVPNALPPNPIAMLVALA